MPKNKVLLSFFSSTNIHKLTISQLEAPLNRKKMLTKKQAKESCRPLGLMCFRKSNTLKKTKNVHLEKNNYRSKHAASLK